MYLLKSERFCEEHEGKYNSHGLSPGGHCKEMNTLLPPVGIILIT